MRSPNSLSSPPYCIRSSNPLTAIISFFHPEALCPFQLAFVVVTLFRNQDINPDAVNLLFLSLTFIVVYVGAIAVLFLFVVMMLNVAQQKNQWFSAQESSKHIPIGLIVSVIIFFELIIVIGGWKYKPDLVSAMSLTIDKNITNTHSIGYVLYTDYIHVFQLSGMILLVAMIGAIVLTFRQRSGVKRQSYFSQISRERSDGVELIDVENNKGVKSDD